MSTLLGDARVRVRPDTTGFGTALDRGISSSLKKAAGAASAAFAAVGVAGFAKDIVNLASKAEQSIGGVQAVFQDYAKTVQDSAKQADRALGLSGNSYRELATLIGAQLKNAGVPLDQLGHKTEGLISQGADLAAMFGGTTAEAVAALSSALKGEMDPIEKYGISLNDAALKAEAAALGLDVMGGTLSTSQRAMAVMSLVTKQGADAVGAFARESETAAGRSERAAAQFENLQTAIGEQLLPVWSGLMEFVGETAIPGMEAVGDVVGDTVGWFSDLPTPVLATATALAGVALLKGPVGSAMDTIALRAMYARDAVAGASLSMSGLRTAGSGLVGFLGGPWGIAITGVVGGLSLLTSWLGKSDDAAAAATDGQRDLAAALAASKGAIDANVQAAAAKAAQDKGLLDAMEAAGLSTENVTDAILGQGNAYNEVMTGLIAYRDAHTGMTGERTKEATAVAGAIESLKDLSAQSEGNIADARQLARATGETSAAMVASTMQTAEATEALKKWLDEVQKIGARFVEPLSVYEGLLSAKSESESLAASTTEAMTESGATSWNDFAEKVGVSLTEYADQLESQLLAQENWRTNIVAVTQRGGLEVGQALLAMGEEGALLTAQMVDATDAEFKRLADLMARDARLGGEGATAELDAQMKFMEIVGRDGAGATRRAIAAELNLGVGEVQDIANKYGVNLATGINPILRGLGKAPVNLNQQPGRRYPGVNEYFDGGYTGDGGKYEPKGIVHGGEFVFTKEETRRAGVGRLADLAKSLRGYATGGFVSADDIPRPPGTAPFQYPISTAADATMEHAYSTMTDWLRANAEAVFGGTAGSGTVGGAWGSLWQLVKRQIPQARINSTFRAGDPGYHGRGKAIDFGFGSGPGGAGSAGLAAINRLLYDQLGANLAELIYDGIGDDRPDLKNGRPLVYSAATRAEHRNHVHAAVYDDGGILEPGMTLVDDRSRKVEGVLNNEQLGWLQEAANKESQAALINGDVHFHSHSGDWREGMDDLSFELRRLKRGGRGR